MSSESQQQLSELTTEIIASYVSNHKVAPDQISTLITDVHMALARAPQMAAQPAAPDQEPAVPVKKSVKKDHIVCLECGKPFKSLKRHLGGEHEMTPDEYRAKWNLPRDYPMVAAAYSEARSALAKSMGLGRKSAAAGKKATRKRGRG